MTRRLLILALAALASGSLASLTWSDDFWRTKDFRSWTAEECQHMLHKSAWTSSVHKGDVELVLPGVGASGSGPMQPMPSRPPAPPPPGDTRRSAEDFYVPTPGTSGSPRTRVPLIYVAQLRSAAPIRQALVRESMLRAKYDQMTAERKAEVDRSAERFLTVAFDDMVLVWLSYPDGPLIRQFWTTQNLESIGPAVALRNDVNEQLRLIKLEAQQRGVLFTFARLSNGAPIVKPTTKELILEAPHPESAKGRTSKLTFKFHVPQMIESGTVLY